MCRAGALHVDPIREGLRLPWAPSVALGPPWRPLGFLGGLWASSVALGLPWGSLGYLGGPWAFPCSTFSGFQDPVSAPFLPAPLGPLPMLPLPRQQ